MKANQTCALIKIRNVNIWWDIDTSSVEINLFPITLLAKSDLFGVAYLKHFCNFSRGKCVLIGN